MRKLIFALALGAILIPNQGFTLGLGEIEVNSSLNQKLTARIDLLSAAPEDAESLIIKLASREEFVRAGLDRPTVLSSLKFRTSVEDDHVYINVLSPKPIREPFLNFLVEVDWPKGHLIREYTILLDPPVFMGSRQKSAPVSGRPAMRESTGSAPVAVQSPVSDDFRPAARSPGSVEPVAVATEAFTAEPVQQQTTYTAPRYSAPSGHRVQAGDTAWSIANSTKPDSVSTEQMLIAMLRTNPEVFINENVNGLKKGYILRSPDNETINAVNHEEAKAAVRQQNALWREYQQSLSSDQPASAIGEDYSESEYSSAVNMNDDSRLSIVSAGSGGSASGEMKDPTEMTAGELREQLALSRERVETERVEKETLQQQVGSLSTQVDKMKGLMTIEDDAMAEMQSAGDSFDEATLALDNASEEVVIEEEVAEPTGTAEEQAIDALDALIGASDEESDAGAEELFVDETDAVAELAADAEVTEQEMLSDIEPDYTAPEESTLLDTLLNNRMILAILLLVVLVVGAIVYLIKRRRDNNTSSDDDSSAVDIFSIDEEDALEDVADMVDDESIDNLVSDEEVEASMAEAEAEEEEFDAEATMILPSGTGTVVAPAASLQAEEEEQEEEQDDVLAEADVYLAYGIYQQAEELLENAIKENPDKDSYRVKLAETYFAGKNAEAMAKLGVEMKQKVGNSESAAWTKVATLGKELCPDEEVFQLADSDTTLDVNDLMPKSPEPMDIDLGADDGVAELDMDFDSPLEEPTDDTGLELPSMDLDMDMDMDETAIISPTDSAESLDELEFDLSETDALEELPVEESADEEEFSLDIEASELDLGTDTADEGLDAALDMDLDMGLDMSMDAEPESESISEIADDSADFDLDMSMDAEPESESVSEIADDAADFDLDMSMDAEPESESVSEVVDDAMDFDLGLSDDDGEAEIDLTDEANDLGLSMDDDLGSMDLSEPLDAEEVNTKLDLAKAYLDMGDHEGARDILDEVIAGGDAEQKKEAQELMAQAN